MGFENEITFDEFIKTLLLNGVKHVIRGFNEVEIETSSWLMPRRLPGYSKISVFSNGIDHADLWRTKKLPENLELKFTNNGDVYLPEILEVPKTSRIILQNSGAVTFHNLANISGVTIGDEVGMFWAHRIFNEVIETRDLKSIFENKSAEKIWKQFLRGELSREHFQTLISLHL